MFKTWVLVLVINGTSADISPVMNINECTSAMKQYVAKHPKLKYNVFCEWRTNGL